MSKIKILLVYPNLQMINLLPSNIALLSAYLKEAGMEVKLFDTTLYKTAEKSLDEIRVDRMQLRKFNLKDKGVDYKTTDVFDDFKGVVKQFKPDVIGISATDDTYDLGIALIAGLGAKQAHVIVGGVYPSFRPDDVIKNPLVDSICIGEGEGAIVELCRKIGSGEDITGIKNLWVKKDGEVHKNGLRPLIDINKTPYEDFSVFEEKRLFRPMQGKIYRMIPICIDRGCPFNCSFCAAPFVRKLYLDASKEKNFRVKSISRVMDELQYQVERFKADYIYFNSETFFARKESDIEEFAKEYSSKIGLPFWCQTRIDTITARRARILKDMNCDRVSIGLEHGNEKFRKNILKKNFTNSQAIESFRIMKEAKIPVTVNNIIGFPDETRELAFDTIKLNRQIMADSINAVFFVPYSGTELRDYCLNKGYITPDTKTASLHGESILSMPSFPPDEINGLVRTFPLYVRMPESWYGRIRTAEKADEEGRKALAELRDIYFKEYFK